MDNTITNPLYTLTVGSVAFGEDGRFGGSVLGSGATITNFVPGASGEMSMSGSSEYVYSDQMNQASLGLSGSYGLSGAAKISAKLSGYFGQTVADSGKTLSIMLNSIDWAGVEYIDFNDINPQELMSALSTNAMTSLNTALKNFTEMQKASLPAIEMTLGGILVAGNSVEPGKWRDEATVKKALEEDLRNTLIVELSGHSNNARTNEHYYQGFNNEELIGKGAVVVFLLEAGIKDFAWLQDHSDDDQRKALIDDLAQRIGSTDLQGISRNQDLVQFAWTALNPKVQDWVRAVEVFFTNFGTGLVVGVLWGGWGAAKLTFHTADEENRWKYGGSGNFEYAGVGAAVSVSAAYGGSHSTIGQKASATVEAIYNGACVKTKIEQWAQDLNDLASKGLSELGDQPVTRNATLDAPLGAPSIPDFAKPEVNPTVTDYFKNIQSLDGLKAYALAAAWEKKKNDGGTQSLQDFLNEADGKNDVSGVPDDDKTSVIVPSQTAQIQILRPGIESRVSELQAGLPPAEPPNPTDKSNYEPIGVWIVNWARLFPWLVTGHDNAITPGLPVLDWIRVKTLHQDCLSLTRLYDRLDGEGCKVLVNDQPVDFRGISDSFSHAAAEIADFLEKSPAITVVSDKIQSVISEMSADARNIYTKWDKFPQFRRCQLGAGIIFEQWDGNTTVGDLKPGSPIEIIEETCTFQVPDYSAFARYGKAWPFITPDGNILAFVSVGDASSSGILSFRRHFITDDHSPKLYSNDTLSLNKQATFSAGRWTSVVDYRADVPTSTYDPWFNADMALPFAQYDPQARPDLNVGVASQREGDGYDTLMWNAAKLIHLYPIPFDAANGISWKGCAMTTGMGTLGEDLRAIKDELSQMNRYTFDSDLWDGVSDVANLIYSMQMLQPTYIGLTDAPPNNIMPR